MSKKDFDYLVSFLKRTAKQTFDNGKRLYYLDYNGKGRKQAHPQHLFKDN